MAGESPGKSEQRKSSGETADNERDPRLAMFRETSPKPPERAADDPVRAETDASPDEAAVPDVRADHASGPVPEPDSAAGAQAARGTDGDDGPPVTDDGPPVTAAEADAERDAEQAKGSGPAEAGEPDSRLRAAVAAWVATADEPAGDGTVTADDDASADPVAADPAAGTGKPAPRKRDAALGAADDRADADESESVAGSGSRAGAEGAEGAADAGLSVIPAATGADDAPAGTEPEEQQEPRPADDCPAGTEGSAATADSGDTASATTRGATGGSSTTDRATGASTTSHGATGGSSSAGGASAGGSTGGGSFRDSSTTAVSSADADALDTEDAAPEDGATEPAAAESASVEPAGTRGDASAEPVPTKGGDSAGGGAGDGGAGEDRGGIDQATAVFKAVPPAPAAEEVDQPTAMLKLPAKDPKNPENPKGGTGAKPESDVERTSTFVPLKPADVRPAGPPRRPGETAAQPGQPARPDRTGQQPGPGARTGEQARPADRRTGPAAAGTGAGAGAAGLPEAERTKQQPLPPKPPLDLLAELTNKPAPPETPVRTTVRRVKIWTPLLLLLVIVFAAVQLLRPPPETELELSATPSYTFEGGRTEMPWPGEGQSAIEVEGVGSLGTEGPQKPAPIASVAKAMTAYVILKDHPIKGKENGPKIKVDQQAEDDGKKGDESTAQVKAGQEYTQRQMLMMLMIPSGNNVARLLGRWDAGSEEKFVEKMNAAAQDLGMTNTKYTDSSGFDTGTVSTPVDQIKLGRAVMKNDVFREIVDMPEVEIPGLPKKIYNNNKILLKPGVNGIKTGSTTPAGGNLLFTASTVVDGETRRIIGAVMNQSSGALLNDKLDKAIFDSLKLIQKAQEAVTSATVVKKGDVVGYVDDGLGGRTQVVATKDLKAVGWPGLKVDLAIGAAAGKSVPHTGKKGDVVGEVTVGTGPGQVRAPVALRSDLAEPGFGAKLTRVG
ncbi:D-alanyl-D-alanine carboxypeptidase [Streptomyces sp. CA-294286]|uniref:D-alanyl-D-alanine carboxypeptidase family protein n=1 Tax=Streptomyces sp. CA-294286 TaxID=3240070 RepID=UPI003D8B54DD